MTRRREAVKEFLDEVIKTKRLAHEEAMSTEWHYLVKRPHPWRKQLWIQGRKLMASAVWLDALSNGMGVCEAAANWDLPVEVVQEIFAYCEKEKSLIKAEAEEELRRLTERGVKPP